MKSELPVSVDSLMLGESEALLETETSEDCRIVSASMASQANRRLRIISRHLDPPIYDDEAFVSAVRQMVLKSRSARVQILVMDSRPLIRRSHRLLPLAHRLTSYFEFKRPAHQHSAFNAACLIADDCGYLERTFADRYEGNASFNDPRACKALIDTFDELWNAGSDDPNLRRLS